MVVTRPKAFELLLGAGGDARLVAHKGRTPLHYAAHTGAAETVALLIAAGADVDAEEAGGTRPLHYAAGRHTEVVRALLDAGADAKAQRTGPCPFTNLGPDEARTPLEIAKHREAPPELIALLEAAG